MRPHAFVCMCARVCVCVGGIQKSDKEEKDTESLFSWGVCAVGEPVRELRWDGVGGGGVAGQGWGGESPPETQAGDGHVEVRGGSDC